MSALLVAAAWSLASADKWMPPGEQVYVSMNKEYRLQVVPRKVESAAAYFHDKAAGVEPAGAVQGEISGPQATLIRERSDVYVPVSRFPLVNDVAPVAVLVADDGRHVVTFDDWHGRGYGNHVVVIYRADGRVVRSFRLDELVTVDDIARLPHSVSSIHWGKSHRIDESARQLVVTVGDDPFDSPTVEPFALHVDLESGRVIEPIVDRFPKP